MVDPGAKNTECDEIANITALSYEVVKLNPNKQVLVTGASGFVARQLCSLLTSQGLRVRAACRRPGALEGAETIVVGDLHQHTNWEYALRGCDTVVHLAARVHMLRDQAVDPLAAFRQTNTEATLHLARSARAAGVNRLIFVSTIGVHGDCTPIDQPFNEESPIAPVTPYAVSKWEAEQGLRALGDLDVVIVRPPLVYGANAPGNFGQLGRWIKRGLPMPLGWTTNRRSLIAVQNLCDFLSRCVLAPAPIDDTFVISDGEDVSTTELLQRMAQGMRCTARLVPVPPALLKQALTILGRERMATQLLESLVIDSSRARARLGWQPPLTMVQAMAYLDAQF